MKAQKLLPFALLLVACSSGTIQKEAEPAVAVATSAESLLNESATVSCPAETDLRGEGVAADYEQALTIAQKSVSAQIQSTVSASSRSKVVQTEDADGNEIVQSSFDLESKVLTRLENAQDVKVVSNETVAGGKVKVVACMSRSDAMKPFVLKSRILQDSLYLLSKTYEGASHPIQKNKAYKDVRREYISYVTNRNILESFGMVDQAASAVADSEYVAVHSDFANFLMSYAFYFATPENEMEQSIFSVVSKNFSVIGGECKGGIILKAGSQNLNCKEGSLGIKCSVTLTLTGSSCEGERYFDLQETVAGSGKYTEAEAIEKLNKNIQKAEWFAEWRRELNRWRMK